MKTSILILLILITVVISNAQDTTVTDSTKAHVASDTIPEYQKHYQRVFGPDNNTHRAYYRDSVYMIYKDSTAHFIVYRRHFGEEILRNLAVMNQNQAIKERYLISIIVLIVITIGLLMYNIVKK